VTIFAGSGKIVATFREPRRCAIERRGVAVVRPAPLARSPSLSGRN
jgi:hypothetical protein